MRSVRPRGWRAGAPEPGVRLPGPQAGRFAWNFEGRAGASSRPPPGERYPASHDPNRGQPRSDAPFDLLASRGRGRLPLNKGRDGRSVPPPTPSRGCRPDRSSHLASGLRREERLPGRRLTRSDLGTNPKAPKERARNAGCYGARVPTRGPQAVQRGGDSRAMKGRFRIRTRDGKELRPQTTEVFAELIRTGAILPDDLVFDALTGKWIPVEGHPMALLARDPLVAGAAEPGVPEPGVPEPGVPGPGAPEDVEQTIELVEPPPVSPEEAAREFIRRMEEERRAESEEPALSREIPLVVERSEGSGSPRDTGPLLQPVKKLEPTPARRLGHESSDRPPTHGVRDVPPRADPGDGRRGPGRLLPWRRIAVSGVVATLSLGALAVFAAVACPSLRVGDRMPDFAETPAVAPPAGAGSTTPRRPSGEPPTRASSYRWTVCAAASTSGRCRRPGSPARTSRTPGITRKCAAIGSATSATSSRPRRTRRVSTDRPTWARWTRRAQRDPCGPCASRRRWVASTPRPRPGGGIRTRLGVGGLGAGAARYADGAARQGPLRACPGPRVSADPVIEAVATDSDAQLRFDSALDRVLRALKAGDQPLAPEAIPDWVAKSLREAQGGTSLAY